MATFSKSLDIYQGYNYKKDVQTPVGFITALKIGDVTLKADQTCKDPMAPETDLAVVAVLSGSMWELGVTDAHYFTGQISVYNKQQVQLLTYKDLTKVDCEYTFSVYEYDPIEKKYFKCLLPTDDATLKGILEKNGRDLNLSAADDASPEVQSPENYAFQIGIKPQPSAQTVTVAVSFSDKVVKSWGLTVTK
ncbi:hypothetical protein [Paraliomyxa miuraensis]|uniref:hypothetical protein n=1 Tax=Paraliomyxa miuraensis TaxID=376150 RepID=UPI0022519354|nr:hypothetical protein [Paraliomyxa miuraensis]MCX4244130.1 hypothetical protein [Paraliomyxa miuraensis]